MKKFLTLILFAIITTSSFAQSNYQDVVYLKNGGIIRGIIIEQIPNKSVKIEIIGGNIFVFQMDEIEKITREPYKGKKGNFSKNTGLRPGYKGLIDFGYQFGVGSYGEDRLTLNIINGLQVNPYFSVAFGTGLRYYFDIEEAIIPVYVDFRTNFLNKNISPYLALAVGYSFDATNDFEGVGFLLIPTAGISFKLSETSALHIGFGYELQSMKVYRYNYFGYSSETDNSGAITLNIGLSF